MEDHPSCITEAAYEWCSVICEHHSSLENGNGLLLLSLEVGFRHLKLHCGGVAAAKLTHTSHHQKMVDIVFRSGNGEAIADLLYAWTSWSRSHQPCAFLKMCAGHLIGLYNMQPFPPRLRQLVIRSIEFLGYQAFEQVGVERFAGLLNNLHVGVEDLGNKVQWGRLLLDTIQSPKGVQHLSLPYWEFLVEHGIPNPSGLALHTYSPHTMIFLEAAKEWDKLECWLGVIWILWPLGCGRITVEDLEHVTFSLFCQQPSAIQRLKQWMKQWSKRHSGYRVPKSFQLICEQAHAKAAQL
jgi:hypothetical protein